jgi:hypothetical protein
MVPRSNLGANLRKGQGDRKVFRSQDPLLAKHTSKVNFVSSGAVADQTTQLGFNKAFLVRDPDGHAVEIEEK